MKVLVLNSGSSSIKYQLFDMKDQAVLATGLLEQIGESGSCLTQQTRNLQGQMEEVVKKQQVQDHQAGFELINAVLSESGAVTDKGELFGIGHRVVHGGEAFREPTRIDADVISVIRELVPLAPLHNPANLLGIEVAMKAAPQVPQVAVFDTAFHHSLPPKAYHYALPQNFYERHNIRRYGFHGTSHHYVAKKAASFLDRPLTSLNLITLHLGNGASLTAIENGRSIDTSMGMTPMEGLIMGTRCGDIDPAIVFYLGRKTGLARDEIEAILNKESGLKGICGANDMRSIGESADKGDPHARLAIAMYCYRIKKYIGAYYAVLGHIDAVVFTGGIGQNAAFIRRDVCAGLTHLGIEVDLVKNSIRSSGPVEIQSESGKVKILVIPTNEELQIAEETVAQIRSNS